MHPLPELVEEVERAVVLLRLHQDEAVAGADQEVEVTEELLDGA